MNHERSQGAVLRFALVALVLPAMVSTVALAIQLAVSAQASTQGSELSRGHGTSSAGTPLLAQLVLTAVLCFGLPAVFALSCLPTMLRGNRSPTLRLFGAQALGLSVLLATIMTSHSLRGTATDLSDDSGVLVVLLIGIPAGVAAAVLGWFAQPRGLRPTPPPDVVPFDLASSERAAWMRTSYLPVPALAVISAVATVVAIKAAFGWAAGDHGGVAAILTAVSLLLITLLVATAAFHIRVDARGLTIRSLLGIPRFRVAVQDVDTVAVVDSRSLGVPGSWGIRVLPGHVTIVMQSTTGIRVTRHDGRIFFVTVDDAARGASLLEELAARSRDEAV